MRDIVLIAHDMRSTFNVGSLFRTAEGLGVSKIYLTGYTSYPKQENDSRLPHISQKLDAQIAKTALGAEKLLAWEHNPNIEPILGNLKINGFELVALEQSAHAVTLPDYNPPAKIALVLGTEVTGVPANVLKRIPTHLEIPMYGDKESFNVVVAAAIAMYHIRFR